MWFWGGVYHDSGSYLQGAPNIAPSRILFFSLIIKGLADTKFTLQFTLQDPRGSVFLEIAFMGFWEKLRRFDVIFASWNAIEGIECYIYEAVFGIERIGTDMPHASRFRGCSMWDTLYLQSILCWYGVNSHNWEIFRHSKFCDTNGAFWAFPVMSQTFV